LPVSAHSSSTIIRQPQWSETEFPVLMPPPLLYRSLS
jgi:hypothetical protein